jgi:hypothetical protein
MASLYTSDQLYATSEAALRDFNERYLALNAVGPTPNWASPFVMSTDAPRTTFPLSTIAAKFKETRDQHGTVKTLDEKSFDLKTVEFDAGFEAKIYDLSRFVYSARNWAKAPAELQAAEQRHVAYKLRDFLEAGTGTTLGTNPWDGLAFFSASHLSNPFNPDSTTWSNYQSSTKDVISITNLTAEIVNMMGVLDVNGDKLEVQPTAVWVPTAKYQGLVNLLSQNMINNGETNPLAGKLKVVHVPQLTDADDWYLVDENLIARGFDPFIAMKEQVDGSLGLRMFDENSDFAKSTGKIKVSQHIWYGFGYALPHAIRLVKGA